MGEKFRRNYLICGALLWAITPIIFWVMLISDFESVAWFCLLLGQIFVFAAVDGGKRYLIAISMAACLPLVIYAHSSILSPKALFCLWLANAGTLYCLRSESARASKPKATQSFTSALIFISIFLFGEIILGQMMKSHHRLSDFGYYASIARFIGVVVFGGGCWLYCIQGASHFSKTASSDNSMNGEPPSL